MKRAQNKGERGPDGFGYQGQQRGPQGQTGYWGELGTKHLSLVTTTT